MSGIVNIHKRVYRNDGNEDSTEISHNGIKLYRFMDMFYLSCESEHLEEDEVAEQSYPPLMPKSRMHFASLLMRRRRTVS
jgi:hypothetical protein